MERTTAESDRDSSSQERPGNADRKVDRPGGVAGPVAALHGAVGNQTVKEIHERGEVQAKLDVSQPADASEREAERVADEVVGMDDSPDVAVTRRATESGGTVSGETESKIRSVTSGGRPLPESARSFFESRFGRDFSDVRLHTGPSADEAARSINAEAFTYGSDVVFASGQFDPVSRSGKRLIAHELAHVVQQTGSAGRRTGDRLARQSSEESISGPVMKAIKDITGTKAGLVSSIRGMNLSRFSSTSEALATIMRVSKTFDQRYLLMKRMEAYSNGVLDLKHFFYAAGSAYSGEPTKEVLGVDSAPSGVMWADMMGFAQEVNQWMAVSPSGFSTEDVPSNSVGARFGQELAEKNTSPQGIPDVLDDYLDRFDPIDPSDVGQLDVDKLRFGTDLIVNFDH